VSSAEIAAALSAQRAVGQDPAARREAKRLITAIAASEERALLRTRVESERPMVERLIAFWSNHFAVSTVGKVALAPLAGSYEREAIRPRVLGRFEDLALASATHPAMLVYLDNFQSVGPGSAAVRDARRAGAQRGLNENYARELLELHTLGVDGGYSQEDVQSLARILTGWTVSGLPGSPAAPPLRTRLQRSADSEPIRFAFEPSLHEPGPKTLLGRRYDEAGIAEGERAIRALCAHPSTADLVARKLVTHFVADVPPPAAVAAVSRVFRETSGDLRAVSLALIDLEEAWVPESRKIRSPQDWLIALFRALGGVEATVDRIGPFLRQIRHPLWAPPSPAGFGDLTRDWADPDSLLNRAELARTLASRLGRGATDPTRLLEIVDVSADDPLRGILADRSIAPAERIALGVASPSFQWR